MINKSTGKIEILSDIHGNFIALESMISILKVYNPDYYFVLGDIIGYFPDGNSVLDLLKQINAICIKGNHEEMVLTNNYYGKDNYYKLKKQKLDLIQEYTDWIKSWPDSILIKLGKYNLKMVHGSLTSPLNGYIYPNSDLSSLNMLNIDILFSGHTHRPFKSLFNNKLICNVGSVGLPRDGSGKSSAVIFNYNNMECDIIQIDINLDIIKEYYYGLVHHDIIKRLEKLN